MSAQGYPEAALVANRTSLLLCGGSDSDRRAWAEEAASNFEGEGPLRVATDDAQLLQAFATARGVVFIPDVSAISSNRQGELVRILRLREERPKFVVGIAGSPVTAREQGRIRWDLSYVLQVARVNLDDPAVK
ncbi:MAG: Fis family transcriptional regulator, partial [Myxococcaceae bacterium]